MTKPLILIDGSSYLFRAYHALPPLTNSRGMPTGAIYGVLNMLRKLLKEYQPVHIAVVFDSKSPNFRHELYSAYKANRATMPLDLEVQIQPLFDAIRALGLPLVVCEGVEADDIIATLAHEAQQKGMPVLISTGDKDLAQLVNPKVTLINTMSHQIFDENAVREKFGVSPAQMIDYLALTGDTVDNIPGVPKVGPKTAAAWLAKYHSLDNLLQHAAEIPGKVGENLRNSIEAVLLGRKLVTVKTDIPLSQSVTQLAPAASDNEMLKKIFTDLEFKNWLAELRDTSPTEKNAVESKYTTILDQKTFQNWLEKLERADAFAFDTETTDLDAMRAELVGLSFSIQPNEAAYVPLMHDYLGAPQQLKRDWVLAQLKPLFNDPKKLIIGQNLKYDLKILGHYGVTVSAKLWDSLLASYIVDGTAVRHDLDSLALRHLSYKTVSFEDIAGKGAKQLTFNKIPLEKSAFYAAEDADITFRLYQILNKKLESDGELKKLFTDIEMPLMPILMKMEQHGVLIDVKKLKAQSLALKEKISALEQEVYLLSGKNFNLDSPKQLQEVLFTQLKIPVLKKTPTGQPSTAENVLQELAQSHPIPKLILSYRSLSKLKSTYTDSLPEQVNPRTGRVHTSYQQAVTATGRLSSTEPNLQNIPVRSEEGRKIRQAFIAPPGYKIISADYSQVELRIMAHLSQDPGLLKAFAEGLDVHAATAAEVFGVKLDHVTAEQRRRAKAVNFGLMYGMSSYGLSQQINVSREEAQHYIDTYFSRYPNVHDYMEKARALAAKLGYVQTLYGRRVAVPDIHAQQQSRRLGAERQAINAPLQGSAADIIKLAMICIDQWLTHARPPAAMIMQVHDELVFEVANAVIEETSQEIRRCMEHVAELSVPLLVEIGIGSNWDAAH